MESSFCLLRGAGVACLAPDLWAVPPLKGECRTCPACALAHWLKQNSPITTRVKRKLFEASVNVSSKRLKMALFWVVSAAEFPVLHLGRVTRRKCFYLSFFFIHLIPDGVFHCDETTHINVENNLQGFLMRGGVCA